MSVRESRQGVVTLGSCRVRVDYPGRLGDWFDGLVDRKRAGGLTNKWVRLRDDAPQEGFRVTSSSGRDVAARGLGDALATFWEHVTFLLVDQLGDALALHAAAVRRDDEIVLLPGSSGAGKTQLALWYRAQGFALRTDEVAVLSFRRASGSLVDRCAGPAPLPQGDGRFCGRVADGWLADAARRSRSRAPGRRRRSTTC